MTEALEPQQLGKNIFFVRGRHVMVDTDLARLYGVATSNLNKAVRRNLGRFPADFMFQLTNEEATNLIFQSGISSPTWGGRRKPSFVFTEQGVAMLSSVLRSERAVQVNIAIMRAFVRSRALLADREALGRRLDSVERRLQDHGAALGEQREEIHAVFAAIRRLIGPARRRRPRIGFKP